MKPSVEQLGNLLALQRHEGPEEGYWQDFLCEFHRRQREQAVKKPAVAGWFAGLAEWIGSMGSSKWAYGAGVAYASIAVVMILNPRDAAKDSMPASPVNYQVVPAPAPPPVEQLDQLDLSPSTQGNPGEQVF